MMLNLTCSMLQDTTITRVTHEMENLRTEMREKDIQLTAMQAKARDLYVNEVLEHKISKCRSDLFLQSL